MARHCDVLRNTYIGVLSELFAKRNMPCSTLHSMHIELSVLSTMYSRLAQNARGLGVVPTYHTVLDPAMLGTPSV